MVSDGDGNARPDALRDRDGVPQSDGHADGYPYADGYANPDPDPHADANSYEHADPHRDGNAHGDGDSSRTPTVAPTRSPTVPATMAPTGPPPAGANVVCRDAGTTQICAWVSNGTPAQNSSVTVYGRLFAGGGGVSGARMVATWHYKTTTPTCEGVTGSGGVASCTRDIGRATKGYRVDVVVAINGYTATTFFVPG